MFWGLFFVVAVVVAGWPIQVVTIVVIFGLFVLFDDHEGGIGLDAARLSSASLAKIFGKVQCGNCRNGFAGAALQEIENSFRHRGLFKLQTPNVCIAITRIYHQINLVWKQFR